MSQRVDQRKPTRVELDAYDKILKLNNHIMSVCKPRDNNPNNHHIPKRNAGIGKMLMEAVIEMGADVLEANRIYVGENIPVEDRLENYRERIRLQEHADRLTFRAEHILRVLHYDKPFADSTLKFALDLICEERAVLRAWKEADKKAAKSLRK